MALMVAKGLKVSGNFSMLGSLSCSFQLISMKFEMLLDQPSQNIPMSLLSDNCKIKEITIALLIASAEFDTDLHSDVCQ